MDEFTLRTPQQLPALLQAFRKAAGLSQAEAAARLGVTQQTFSAGRLLKLLTLLGVEVVLRPASTAGHGGPAAGTAEW